MYYSWGTIIWYNVFFMGTTWNNVFFMGTITWLLGLGAVAFGWFPLLGLGAVEFGGFPLLGLGTVEFGRFPSWVQ
jgi:hypothetical protein